MMTNSQIFLRWLRNAVLSCVLCFGPGAWAAVDFYSPDKNHLWNRVYAGLIVRERAGAVYDDLLDPPYYAETTHLLSGESHAVALAQLREFTGNAGALREMTPLARAVMQRDLIALVHWIGHAKAGPEQQALGRALVQAVRFVALSSEEIGKLPDNYAQAAAKLKVAEFDPNEPDRAFLPTDLLSNEGPWISVEPTEPDDPLAAPVHTQVFSGRSVMEVRFRHADGREAGEKYLKAVAALPPKQAGLSPKQAAAERARITPQFPPGSMWAMVRRAILVDAAGKLVASPLIESVELRYYRKIETDFREAQAGFEWELSRRLLFGAGGFHRTEQRDQYFARFFESIRDRMDATEKVVLKAGEPALCMSCHLEPGMLSVNSHTRDFRLGGTRERPDLRPTTRARMAEVAVDLANKRGGWEFLRKWWDEK